jgi:peptide/nickel transport system substrate-binding protein
MKQFSLRLAFLALIALTSCTSTPGTPTTGGSAPPAAGPERADQQNLRIAIRGMVSTPTPTTGTGQQHMLWPMYDKLTQYERTYDPRPAVATSWALSNDGKLWTFTIRNDMAFSNGDKLTAADVAFSLNTVRELKWPQVSYFTTVTDVRAVGDTTVEIVTGRLDTTIPYAATFLWILPMKYFQQVGFDGFAQKPIGSGPYVMVEFQPGSLLRFKKQSTPHPFRKPVADELTFQDIPDNSQIIAGLQTGDIDLATDIPFSGVQANQLRQAGMEVGTHFTSVISLNIYEGPYQTRNTPLQDQRVRLALKYAINRDVIASKIFSGYTKVANEIALPGAANSDPNLKPVPYDPAMAKQLLAEAGYTNGFKLPVGMDWTPSWTLQDVVLAIQGDLKAVGVETELHSQELATIVDKALGRNNQTLADIAIGRNVDVIGFGPSRTFLGCNKPVGGTPAILQWCDPEWDRLQDAAYAEPDAAKRSELLREASDRQVEAAHTLPLYFEPSFFAYNPKLQDVTYQHDVFYNFDAVYRAK